MPPTALGPFHRFVVEHEDRWLFVILYVGLAVALSIVLTLFWLVVLLVVHFVFELVAHRETDGRRPGLVRATLWSVKLDIALVLFALALSLYLDFIFGVLGLRAAASASGAMRGGARMAAWTRGIRAALLTADDAAQVARAAARGRKSADTAEGKGHESHDNAWGVGDWIAIVLGVLCFGLILAAPYITDLSWPAVADALGRELRPWP